MLLRRSRAWNITWIVRCYVTSQLVAFLEQHLEGLLNLAMRCVDMHHPTGTSVPMAGCIGEQKSIRSEVILSSSSCYKVLGPMGTRRALPDALTPSIPSIRYLHIHIACGRYQCTRYYIVFTTFDWGICNSVPNTRSQKRLVTPNPFW